MIAPRRFPVIPETEWRAALIEALVSRGLHDRIETYQPPRRPITTEEIQNRTRTSDNPYLERATFVNVWKSFVHWGHK